MVAKHLQNRGKIYHQTITVIKQFIYYKSAISSTFLFICLFKLNAKGTSYGDHEKDSCKPPGNPRCNPDTWDKYGGYSNACCSDQEKCGIDEGDCNLDSECHGSLVCKHNSCPSSPQDESRRFHERASCCQQPSGSYILGII